MDDDVAAAVAAAIVGIRLLVGAGFVLCFLGAGRAVCFLADTGF